MGPRLGPPRTGVVLHPAPSRTTTRIGRSTRQFGCDLAAPCRADSPPSIASADHRARTCTERRITSRRDACGRLLASRARGPGRSQSARRKNASEGTALERLQQAAAAPGPGVCTYQQARASGSACRTRSEACWSIQVVGTGCTGGCYQIVAEAPRDCRHGCGRRTWPSAALSVAGGEAAGQVLGGAGRGASPRAGPSGCFWRTRSVGLRLESRSDGCRIRWPGPTRARRPPVLTAEHTVLDLAAVARSDSAAVEVDPALVPPAPHDP